MPSIQAFVLIIALFSTVHPAFGFPELSQRQAKPGDKPVNTQTSYIFDGCSVYQTNVLKQAKNDAVTVAMAGLDKVGRELSAAPRKGDQTLDFSTQAAIEYFGPQDQNAPYQQRIFDTLYRATQAYEGYGWSDWWYDRYVTLSCIDRLPPKKGCEPGEAAYTLRKAANKERYSRTVFCKPFFDNHKSHKDQYFNIVKDEKGVLANNVKNMVSQATVMLHEWLHIAGFTAEICEGGCLDTFQTIGPKKEREKSYGAGMVKLLTRKSVKYSPNTNDNYVYFATARFMEKNFHLYPQYPRAWDNTKTVAQNRANEKKEPGAPPNPANEQVEGPDDDGDGTPTATGDPLPPSAYPAWYRPALTAPGPTLPKFAVPKAPELTSYAPNLDDVKCETTAKSPNIDDCVHAFGALNSFPNQGALHGKKGKTWWAGYVNSCALSINYNDSDWSPKCKATLKDVKDHASAIFEKCSDGGLGTVGGQVKFTVDNCPAQIEIIKAAGQPPQGT